MKLVMKIPMINFWMASYVGDQQLCRSWSGKWVKPFHINCSYASTGRKDYARAWAGVRDEVKSRRHCK